MASVCLFCDHPLDGRSKKYCTTCLPPYGTWDDKRGYQRLYLVLDCICGIQPTLGLDRCALPADTRPRYGPPAPHPCCDCDLPVHGKAKRCGPCNSAHRTEVTRKGHATRASRRPDDWQPSNTWRKTEALRRRRKAAERSGTKPTIAKLAARDGWGCHICGKRIDPELTGTRSKYKASIDHLVPLSADGLDEMWNCKLAHLRCNAKRGAGGTVQLALPA
jgi:hypothetical protein